MHANRRSLLLGILGAAVAPAFVPAKVLMPVRQPIWAPELLTRADWLPWALLPGDIVSVQGRLYKVMARVTSTDGPIARRSVELQSCDTERRITSITFG
jgi:hypothetical protein